MMSLTKASLRHSSITYAAQSKAFPLFFVLLLLFPSSLFSATHIQIQASIPADVIASIQSQKLAQSSQWLRLLHFKKGESEIDDPAFFLSANGKQDAKGELLASVAKLISDKSDNDKSMLCYYPSRSHWLLEKLPELNPYIKVPQCVGLAKELAALEAKQVTLILASAHINSPASAFGHTFLRIDASDDTPLVSYAVNYAAQTRETNGFIYAYQGLFGGYQGRYSIETYAKKLKTYSDLEQRDIWEYTLDLTPDEVTRMIRHIFEIRHFYADYFFVSENCSYNLLWLLEVARDDVGLVSQFDYKAIPIDTLRAVKRAGLVKRTEYRPSKRKKVLQKSADIKKHPKALIFAKSEDYDLSLLEELSPTDKVGALELATQLLQVRYGEDKINKKDYLHHLLRLLNVRSKLGESPEVIVKAPVGPEIGHKSTKLTVGLHSKNKITGRIKFSYHDIYDNESGYIAGSYINFFDTAFSLKNSELRLDEINLLDIRSYAVQDEIFKPVSWQVAVGGKRLFDDELYAYLQVGAGITVGSDKLFTYAMVTPAIYHRSNGVSSLGANVGIIYNASSSMKLGLLASKEWFDNKQDIISAEPFMTYSISKDFAVSVKGSYRDINGQAGEEAELSLFWYF